MGTPGSGGSESGDVVVRDRNGDIVIGELPMAGVLDDGDEGVMHDQEESKRGSPRARDLCRILMSRQRNASALRTRSNSTESITRRYRTSLKVRQFARVYYVLFAALLWGILSFVY
jgi:hypothetical protein